MFELFTFGGIAARTADDPRVQVLLRHPKLLGLLVYMAVEGRTRPLTRDELVGLFWPNVTDDRARQSLNQAVAGLRAQLGRNAILREGRLAPRVARDVVCSDTALFDDAYTAGGWGTVLDVYHGEFLAGFMVPDAHGFEDWTSVTREAYRRKAIRSAQHRASRLCEDGDVLQAGWTLAWAAEASPEREDIAAEALELFTDAGQLPLAIEWFGQYASRVRESLGWDPPHDLASRVLRLRETAQLQRTAIECVNNGAADAARVDPAQVSSEQTASTDSIADDSPAPLPSHRVIHDYARSGRAFGAATIAIVLTVAAYVGSRTIGAAAGSSGAAPPRTTMVLSIADRTPGAGWPFLAESAEELLATRIANPPRLYVTVRQEGGTSRLKADLSVFGAVYQSADIVRIELMVSDGQSGQRLRTLRASRPLGDMLLLVDEMVEELVTELRPILGSALSARVARGRTSDVEAWGNLQHSKNLVGEARRFAARGAGAQAIELLDLADSLAQRAVERDPEWPDARLQLADVGREWTSALLAGPRPDFSEIARRLEAAATVLEQAAARWPMEALVAQLAGSVAFERWLAERPPRAEYQLGEATRFLRRAITLDPYAARPWVTLSAIHAARLEHAASAVAAQGALRRDVFGEHTDEIHNRLFNASFELGRDDEAALWCDAINDRGPGRTLGAFCLLTLQGWTSVREPDLTAVDSVVDNLNADPLPLVAIMKPRLRMLKAAVVSRSGDPRVARVLLDSAAAEAKAMGDTDAAAFHAAALIRLGDLATAREVLRKWSASNEKRLPLQRWFHPLNDSGPFSRRQVADPSGSALTLAPASLAPAIEIEPEFVAPSSKQYQKPLTR